MTTPAQPVTYLVSRQDRDSGARDLLAVTEDLAVARREVRAANEDAASGEVVRLWEVTAPADLADEAARVAWVRDMYDFEDPDETDEGIDLLGIYA